MMEAIDLRVLQMLCARLCHDLISPIGAINNGLELIDEMGPDMAGEAIGLIGQSSRQAAARLSCFRLAYGTAPDQGSVGWPDVRDAAQHYFDGSRARLVWPAPASAKPEAGQARMALCMAMLAEDALPYGGTVTVQHPAAGGAAPTVMAEGRSAILKEDMAGALALACPVEEVTARSIHAYVTGLFARAHAVAVHWTQTAPTRLDLRLEPV